MELWMRLLTLYIDELMFAKVLGLCYTRHIRGRVNKIIDKNPFCPVLMDTRIPPTVRFIVAKVSLSL